METIDLETAKWKEEETILREELYEAKLNSNQNLDGLREELRVTQVFSYLLLFLTLLVGDGEIKQ